MTILADSAARARIQNDLEATLIVEAANSVRSPMPIGAAAREAFSMARARNFGGTDFSAMVDVLCDVSGTAKARLKR